MHAVTDDTPPAAPPQTQVHAHDAGRAPFATADVIALFPTMAAARVLGQQGLEPS